MSAPRARPHSPARSSMKPTSGTRYAPVAAIVAMAIGTMVAPVSVARAADPTHADLFEKVQQRVLSYAYFTIFDDVEIGFEGEGTVRLSGSVTDERKQRDIESRILDIDGIVGVLNELTVLPSSRFDDQLRYKIARAIYGNPNFWRYGRGANPPVHIIVNRGHVTLTGVVVSEVDLLQARALAGQFSAFSVTSKLRLAADVRAERALL